MIERDPESTYAFKAMLLAILAVGMFVLLGLADNQVPHPRLQIRDQSGSLMRMDPVLCREPRSDEELVLRIQRGRRGFQIVKCELQAMAKRRA